jgi:translation elongation factor EF-Ts
VNCSAAACWKRASRKPSPTRSFLKDDEKTISQLLSETVAGVGEAIEIRRFAVFTLGDSGEADAGE